MGESYATALPAERWTLLDGTRVWLTSANCPECDMPIATDGESKWCTAQGCAEMPTEQEAK